MDERDNIVCILTEGEREREGEGGRIGCNGKEAGQSGS